MLKSYGVVGGGWVDLDYNVSSGPFLSFEIKIGDGPGPELDNFIPKQFSFWYCLTFQAWWWKSCPIILFSHRSRAFGRRAIILFWQHFWLGKQRICDMLHPITLWLSTHFLFVKMTLKSSSSTCIFLVIFIAWKLIHPIVTKRYRVCG